MDEIENFKRGETFYDTLGCAESSTREQITEEYKQRVKSCHPDKNPDDQVSLERFQALQHAYAVLTSEDGRKSYDKWLHSGLAVSFECWQNMTKRGHGAVHFGRSPGMKLKIETTHESDTGTHDQHKVGNSDYDENSRDNKSPDVVDTGHGNNPSSSSVPSQSEKSENRTMSVDISEPTSSTQRKYHSGFSSGRSKFRKYEI